MRSRNRFKSDHRSGKRFSSLSIGGGDVVGDCTGTVADLPIIKATAASKAITTTSRSLRNIDWNIDLEPRYRRMAHVKASPNIR
jgi:hypothetical protein